MDSVAAGASALEFRLLGPLEIVRGDQPIGIKSTPKALRALVGLLYDAPKFVSVHDLRKRIWDDPPGVQQQHQLLHKYISWLRRDLGQDRELIEFRRDAGYRIAVDPGSIDARRFVELVTGAGREAARDPHGAMAVLEQALGLWRGAALAGLGDGWLERYRVDLEGRRVAARLQLCRLRLAAGVTTDLLESLAQLHLDAPANGAVAELLIAALTEAGEFDRARQVYDGLGEQTRSRLAPRLGADVGERFAVPGPVAGAPTGPAAAPGTGSVAAPNLPHQLGAALPNFVGRTDALRRLDAAVAPDAPGGPARVLIIDGQPGVGKTALALHWAHRVAARFPDGQLFLDLHGFDPTGTPVKPAAAAKRLLVGSGMDKRRIEPDPEERLDQYRTELAGRSVLLVLDNAANAEQVAPLIPASPGSLVLITSRRDLTGLRVRHAARSVPLGLPEPVEAAEILRSHLDGRAVEPETVREIVSACERLPLALAIVGARISGSRREEVSGILDGLSEGLAAFDTGEETTDATAVFRWSYLQLPDSEQRTFRLLGRHPGPELGVDAVAALCDLGQEAAADSLAELRAVRLIERAAAGRYTFHDLLRRYAADLEAPSEDAEALHRLLVFYVHSADRCATRMRRHRQPLDLPPLLAGVRPVGAATEQDAISWFTTEYPVLRRLIARASELGHPAYGWRLLATMVDYLDWQGLWDDWAELAEIALATCELAGDRPGYRRSERSLGRALVQLGQYEKAEVHLSGALADFREAGDRDGEMRLHHDLGDLRIRQGRLPDALAETTASYRIAEELGNRQEQATALGGMGWCHLQLGDYDATVECCRPAIDVHRETAFARGEAAAQDTLGVALSKLGRYDDAARCLERSAGLCWQVGDMPNRAGVLDHLGDCRAEAGDREAARAAWNSAAGILRELRHPALAAVEAKLSADSGTGPAS